jgi:hypothetical protein
MTSSTVNPHASSSGGTLRAQAQQVGWRESLARWIMATRFLTLRRQRTTYG